MSISTALGALAAAAPICRVPAPVVGGRVVAYDGLTLEAAGIDLAVGTICAVGPNAVAAEVIGFRDRRSVLMGLTALGPLLPGGAVIPLRGEARASVGPELLGRVIDGGGRPLDGDQRLPRMAKMPLEPPVRNPLTKTRITEVLDVGVRAINALLTLGRGQRVGIMAGSGVGKSVLLGQIARFTAADIVVVALIGERGREIADFLARQVDDAARARTIVVAVPADDAPLLRVRGVMRAHAIAEWFRGQGKAVVLIVDSLTRVAHAQREIALALGEAVGARGYPPSTMRSAAARSPRSTPCSPTATI
jgi:flagellum-specific ATP synthase